MISRIHHEAENASNKVRTMGKRSRGLGTGATRSFTVSRSLIARRKKKKRKTLLFGCLLTRWALNQRAREIAHSKTFRNRVLEEIFPRSVLFFFSNLSCRVFRRICLQARLYSASPGRVHENDRQEDAGSEGIDDEQSC